MKSKKIYILSLFFNFFSTYFVYCLNNIQNENLNSEKKLLNENSSSKFFDIKNSEDEKILKIEKLIEEQEDDDDFIEVEKNDDILKMRKIEELIEKNIIINYDDLNFLSFYFNLGFDFYQSSKFNQKFPRKLLGLLGSNFIDISLCYNLIPFSNFALCVGIGYSLLHFSFEKKKKNINTIIYNENHKINEATDCDDIIIGDKKKVIGSYLSADYIKFILEFKYFTNKFYPKEGFTFCIGFDFNLNWSSKVKIDYINNFIKKTLVICDDLVLTKFIFGSHFKFFWNRFGLIYEFNFGNIFKNNKKIGSVNFSNIQKIGLCIDLF
jgi:hypothetical protein